jgi:PAS domain S-box-containing protein
MRIDCYSINHTILISKGGIERAIEHRAAPIRDSKGGTIGAVLIFRDAANRRKREQKLLESEKQYRTLADSIPLLCWMANPDGSIIWFNRRWFEYTGTTLAEMEGFGWQSVYDPERLPEVLNRWNDSIRSGQPLEATFPIKGADGVFRQFLTRAVPIVDDQGKLVRWFGTHTDIDEATRTQDALRESEARFQLATEAIAGMVYECDFKAGTVVRSSGLQQLIGYSPAEAEPTIDWWYSRIDPFDRPEIEKRLQAARSGDSRHLETEYKILHRDGTYRAVWDSAILIRNEHNEVVKMTGSTIDATDRIRAEEEAKSTRDRLALALSAGGIGTWDWDVANDLFRPDESMLNIIGIDRDRTHDQSLNAFLDKIHDDDRSRVREAIDTALRLGGPYEQEHRLVLADATETWVVSRGRVEHDEHGRAIRFPGVVIDITEKRKADDRLRFQLDLTKSITDNATTAIFMMDAKSRCTFANPAAEKMTGFRLEELRGQLLHDVIHHHHSDGTPYPIEDCPIDRALPEQTEVRDHRDVFIRKNGEFFPVFCNARVIYKQDIAVGTVIEVRDTTAEIKAEQAAKFLADASEIFAGVQDLKSTLRQVAAHPVPFLCDWSAVDLLDDENGIVRVASSNVDPPNVSIALSPNNPNPAAWGSSDLTKNVISTACPQRIPAEDDVSSEPADGPSLISTGQRSAGTDADGRWETPTPTGASNEADADDEARLGTVKQMPPGPVMATPLIVRGKAFGSLIFVRFDPAKPFTSADLELAMELARRVATAIDNAKLYENLCEADRRKDEFLATLAHELRNPLAPIAHGLQLMKVAAAPDVVVQARLMMERQVSYLVRLVDDLMDISRISRGKLDLQLHPVTLAQVINSAVETCRPLFEEYNHTLRVVLPEVDVVVRADILRLSQVFLNLLNNAAKYSDSGSTITIEASVAGDHVEVAVIDNGIGIEADQLPKVFDLFSQVDGSLEKSRGGLGIGLSLVKRLVDMHGGHIVAHSDGPGTGSRFVVTLPIISAAAVDEQEPEPPSRSLTGLRILVVDDNRDSADTLQLMLQLFGHEIRVGYDGESAVKLAAEFKPDVILLDIGLPKLNGYDACRQIRQSDGLKDVVIIAQTGWGQTEDRQRTKEAGFDLHMVKPLNPTKLLEVLDQRFKPRTD